MKINWRREIAKTFAHFQIGMGVYALVQGWQSGWFGLCFVLFVLAIVCPCSVVGFRALWEWDDARWSNR